MSDCPYKFAVHPGFIFRRYDKPARHDRASRFVGYSSLIKLYDLDPDDCTKWDYILCESNAGKRYKSYVHLHPRADGDYASELIRAIMRYEMGEGPQSEEEAFVEAFGEACRE